MPSTIAFLSDFGTRDQYAGAMKGAALSVCPGATIVDITHDIAPHDVLGGALTLAAAAPYFPPGTVFVAVVDPGVGSSRRGIAAEAGGHRFVAPDNGVLTLAVRHAPFRVVELTTPRYARTPVSRTFEGRDRFAPAAAWLATGLDLSALGREIADPVMLDIPVPVVTSGAIRGEVLQVDRFGNLLTNIDAGAVDRLARSGPVRVTAGSATVGVVETYADAAPGAVCALIGSSNQLEIAVNGDSAAHRLSASRGTPVVVSLA